MTGEGLERALAELPFLERLRPDEIARAARFFRVEKVAPGQALDLTAPELVLVLEGTLAVRTTPLPHLPAREELLRPGDHLGDVSVATGRTQGAHLDARTAAELARLDTAGLEALLDAFPAAALPVCEAVAQELRFKDGILRELGEVEALGLTGPSLEGAISARRGRLLRGASRVVRRAADAVYRETIVRRGREPAFWMLLGFLASLAGARLTVGAILRWHLQDHLFALVRGNSANPVHLHHFNYGLILVCAAGIANLLPHARELSRFWSAVFGLGAGLVFDEWALIWNLDPNYYQPLSLLAAATTAALLLQLVLFRRFWAALARRTLARLAA